jgi:hypothetical protein
MVAHIPRLDRDLEMVSNNEHMVIHLSTKISNPLGQHGSKVKVFVNTPYT